MTGDCRCNTPACDQVDVMPIRIGMRRDLQLACAGCRGAIAGVVTVVERRGAQVPVETERRAFVAPWRRSLVARDLTGRIATGVR